MKSNQFKIKAKVWVYQGPAAWHFVTLPKAQADLIAKSFVGQKRGWGSLPVVVSMKDISWETSIFPDKKSGSYLLPLKKEIRTQAKIADGDMISFVLTVQF